jgi:hypothetical protein
VLTWGGSGAWQPVPGVPALAASPTSLSVRTAGVTTSALAVVDGALLRFDGTAWGPVDDLPVAAATPVSVRILADGDVVLGTTSGILLKDGDAGWSALPGAAAVPVVGDPWDASDGSVNWLRPDGDVLRRDTAGAWTWVDANLPPGLSSVAEVPGRGLVGIRDGRLVAVTGPTTAPFAPSPAITPTGVVHSAATRATFVVDAGCRIERIADRPA